MTTTIESSMMLDSSDIAKVLSSSGPVVKCVLLKASIPTTTTTTDGNRPPPSHPSDLGTTLSHPGDGNQDVRVDTTNESKQSTPPPPPPRIVLKDLMEEIEIDTTPSKSMVSQVLGGGPFTFLGQYEEEGIVLMIRKLPEDLLDREELMDLKTSELRQLCHEREIVIEKHMIEKSDLIDELVAWSHRSNPPWNPHVLQPPLHKARIRGDILVMKVAETKEELDQDDNNPSTATTPRIEVPTNDEFFLNYTLEDYIKFALRTDIPEYEIEANDDDDDDGGGGGGDDSDDDDDGGDTEGGDKEEGEEEEHSADEEEKEHDHRLQEGNSEVDDEEGVPLRLGDDVEIDDEDRAAMFNLVMNEVLRQYREENGRGPDTKELLEIRASIAKELDVPVAHIDAEQADWNKHAKDGTPARENAKTIAFHTEDKVLEYQPDPNEHNYDDLEHEEGFDQRRLEDDDDDDDDEQDADNDDDDDDYERARPPRKRQRMMDHRADTEHDSKPAATVTKGTQETNRGQDSDRETNLGDETSEVAGSNQRRLEDNDDGEQDDDDDERARSPRKRRKIVDHRANAEHDFKPAATVTKGTQETNSAQDSDRETNLGD